MSRELCRNFVLLLVLLFSLLFYHPVDSSLSYDHTNRDVDHDVNDSVTTAAALPREPTLVGINPFVIREVDTRVADDCTIFVSVAAFRDPECVDLVGEVFAAAANPRRIILGVIEQSEPGDPICITKPFYDCRSEKFCPIDNIRRRRVVSRKGKGPTYGRYVSYLMYRGEQYYMMIDSHTGFVQHWDRRVILQLQRARSPRPVLSQYPHGWNKRTTFLRSEREAQINTAVMCNGRYLEHGFIRLVGMIIVRRTEPYPAPYAAAGFMFADARLVHQVPFDPLLDFIFDGEEILYSTRMWTHGYDIFAPDYSVTFHHYGRSNFTSIKFHNVQQSLKDTMMYRAVYWARKRVQYILHATQWNKTTPLVPESNVSVGRIVWRVDKYGLGRARQLSAYNRFAIIDPIYRKAPSTFCSLLTWQNRKV